MMCLAGLYVESKWMRTQPMLGCTVKVNVCTEESSLSYTNEGRLKRLDFFFFFFF